MYEKPWLKITFFLYFQLECYAMGSCVTDHCVKRPECHWSKNTERKKSVPVGTAPCYRGSNGEIGRQEEVRSVWPCFVSSFYEHIICFAWC